MADDLYSVVRQSHALSCAALTCTPIAKGVCNRRGPLAVSFSLSFCSAPFSFFTCDQGVAVWLPDDEDVRMGAKGFKHTPGSTLVVASRRGEANHFSS